MSAFAHAMAEAAFAEAHRGRRRLAPPDRPFNDPRSLTGRLLNDPMPGCSARDQEAAAMREAQWWRL